MPGKKGVKLIQRKSISGKYHSVRELVFAMFEKKPTISKDEAEKIVKKEYPRSNFFGRDGKGGHFTWYKHKWNRMKLEDEKFNIKDVHQEEVKSNGNKRNESKKNKAPNTKKVGAKTMGKRNGRSEDRRVPVRKAKRKVDVKAGETVLQREGNSESSGRDSTTKEVHD